mmetsp:Transcript_72505/g.125784  ORF Transcript_72505/g.125784 Transcript_72505/m.125784 type:complete len:272 (+) Transcript_72505:137-952(+)
MTYRLLHCTSGAFTISACLLWLAQADVTSGRPLMRLEKGGDVLQAHPAEEAGLAALRASHNKSLQSSSRAAELAEFRQVHEHHRNNIMGETATEAPSFPGEPTEKNVSDIVGQMEMQCKDASQIFLSVEALSTVQKEISKVAEVPEESVTIAFSNPDSLIETVHDGDMASRSAVLDVKFSIGVPKGTDPDDIRLKINGVNFKDLTTNLGKEFLALEVIKAEDDITVTKFFAHEKDEPVVGPQGRSVRAQMPSNLLQVVLLVVMTAMTHPMI